MKFSISSMKMPILSVSTKFCYCSVALPFLCGRGGELLSVLRLGVTAASFWVGGMLVSTWGKKFSLKQKEGCKESLELAGRETHFPWWWGEGVLG